MIIVASNGTEVIDNRPEAENADSLAKHFENRYARERIITKSDVKAKLLCIAFSSSEKCISKRCTY